MCMGVLPVSVFVYHMSFCGLWKPEEALDPLKLDLQIVVSYHVSASKQIWELFKNSK